MILNLVMNVMEQGRYQIHIMTKQAKVIHVKNAMELE